VALTARARRRAPVRYVEVASLPRNAMGKLMREELADLKAVPGRT
jgi:acyl-coenzyme A synthetase/AMP-(fatty) acid ligase